MSRWFRFYDDVINDPKVLKLPEGVRWSWVAILCIASKNSGVLPTIQDTAFLLRMNLKKATAIIEALVAAGLLDKTEDSFAPHNWGGRQFLSDGSADRVRRHREKRAAAGLESQWTAPKSLRKEVYARDNNECVYCGSQDDLSLDHKTPESRGGTHDISNLQTACRKCNGEKRDFTHEEYVTRNGGVTLQKRPQSTEADNRTEQKEHCPDAKAPRTKREYSEEFETKFWMPYPRSPTMAKKEAWREWMKLAPEQQQAACQAIEPYKKYLRSKPTLETVHACRFLSQQRFDGFVNGAPAAPPAFDIRSHLV